MKIVVKRSWVILASVWGFTVFALWPVLRHRTGLYPTDVRTNLAIAIAYALAALICFCFYRAEAPRLGRSRALGLVMLIVLLNGFVNEVHQYNVDQRKDLFVNLSNKDWQEKLQADVVRLSPPIAPHTYRFLPNAIVLWMQICRVRFPAARDIYRMLTGLVLFYALFRFACFYTDYLGGILTMMLVAAMFPISFEHYAGQLTDPLSHLSFVLAFIFLETANFPFLLTTLLIGSLAKETVLALCGFYVLFYRRDRNYLVKSLVLCAASLGAYLGVRMLVLHGTMHYGEVSGVHMDHLYYNWLDPAWPWLFVITLCAYFPFLILNWKDTPGLLKRLIFYLVPVLFVSSFLFSWLSETRNWMAVIFVLAVVSGRYFSRCFRLPREADQKITSKSNR